jgi:solute carrier family 25 (adenine nucleotide translocator) protein 4/5/6/31
MVDVCRKVVAAEGPRGLFRGFLPSCAAAVVHRSVLLGVGTILLPLLPPNQSLSALLTSLGASYGVAVVAELAAYPLHTVKARMMLRAGEAAAPAFASVAQCAREVVAGEGWRALYRGGSVVLVRGVAYSLALQALVVSIGVAVGPR